MRILLTGSSGFLGQIIFNKIGNDYIKTLNRKNGDYQISLDLEVPIFDTPFELIIHSAGKAHSTPKTEQQKRAFYDVNVQGTKNLLKGLEHGNALPRAFIFISSVAVYGKETGHLIIEESPLQAKDPYGDSKVQAEITIQDWCKKNNVICTILRLPLIAGPNPPGNLKTMINGLKKGYYFNIAGGKAKKSIVLAEDVAKIIPVAAKIGGVYNLTDQYHPSFSELSQLIAKQLGKSKPLNIPFWIAKLIALAGDMIGNNAIINSKKLLKITSDLTFDDSKARRILGWAPAPVLRDFKIN